MERQRGDSVLAKGPVNDSFVFSETEYSQAWTMLTNRIYGEHQDVAIERQFFQALDGPHKVYHESGSLYNSQYLSYMTHFWIQRRLWVSNKSCGSRTRYKSGVYHMEKSHFRVVYSTLTVTISDQTT